MSAAVANLENCKGSVQDVILLCQWWLENTSKALSCIVKVIVKAMKLSIPEMSNLLLQILSTGQFNVVVTSGCKGGCKVVRGQISELMNCLKEGTGGQSEAVGSAREYLVR